MNPSMHKTVLTGITMVALALLVVAGLHRDFFGWMVPLSIVAAGGMIARSILERPQ